MSFSTESYEIMSIICLVVGAMLLVASIILFYKDNVPKLISDLSGATARKSIKVMSKPADEGITQYLSETSLITEALDMPQETVSLENAKFEIIYDYVEIHSNIETD